MRSDLTGEPGGTSLLSCTFWRGVWTERFNAMNRRLSDGEWYLLPALAMDAASIPEGEKNENLGREIKEDV